MATKKKAAKKAKKKAPKKATSKLRAKPRPVRRYTMTLDLQDDPQLIAEYKRHHEKIWPEITRSIKGSGIDDMEIYLLGTRMFLIMEVNDHFSFEAKGDADRKNPKVQEWEELMWKFQKPLPQARPGEKWLPMERIFKLER